MGAEIANAYNNIPFGEHHEIATAPKFARNLIEIGRIVSRQGVTPPAYAQMLIRFLASCEDETKGFRAEVYLERADDPYLILVKRGSPIQGIAAYNNDHVDISYRPDTRTSLRVKKDEYPECQQFERPETFPLGDLFMDHGTSIFLWMHARMLGRKTINFLDEITSEALAEFVANGEKV